jgi:hypothetical protein
MIDTLDTARAFGLRIRADAGRVGNLSASISFDPYDQASFSAILEVWLPMTFAVNSINRSMGIDDLYPFIISPEVAGKLTLVHNIVGGYSTTDQRVGKRLMRKLIPALFRRGRAGQRLQI